MHRRRNKWAKKLNILHGRHSYYEPSAVKKVASKLLAVTELL